MHSMATLLVKALQVHCDLNLVFTLDIRLAARGSGYPTGITAYQALY
jgi:hypothetical protein